MTSARLVEVASADDLPALLSAAGLTGPRPVLVVVGGASGLDDTGLEDARAVVERVAMPAAVHCGAAVVDGGTDAGVMRLVGRAHAWAGSPNPLVGVAVQRLVRVPGRASTGLGPDAVGAEPHHTHLVLVPGDQWGDESPYLSAVAGLLSGTSPAVTLVVNGGTVTIADVQISVAAGRPVVVAAGTGRTADELAAALHAGGSTAAPVSGWGHGVVASGLVTVLRSDSPLAHRQDQLTRSLLQR